MDNTSHDPKQPILPKKPLLSEIGKQNAFEISEQYKKDVVSWFIASFFVSGVGISYMHWRFKMSPFPLVRSYGSPISFMVFVTAISSTGYYTSYRKFNIRMREFRKEEENYKNWSDFFKDKMKRREIEDE